MLPIFKTKILIYQSKANLDENMLFGNICHIWDPRIRKMPVSGFYRNQEYYVPIWFMIYLSLKF